jgi:hypothetical protein
MVLVIQRYFARPGLAERVLATRREASARLAELGLPTGTILVPHRVAGEGPDVVWICQYRDRTERERLRTLAESDSVFARVRARQATYVERFERDILTELIPTEVIVPTLAAGGTELDAAAHRSETDSDGG